jgi:hypothetical protein
MKTWSQMPLKATKLVCLFLLVVYAVSLGAVGILTKQAISYQIDLHKKPVSNNRLAARNTDKP